MLMNKEQVSQSAVNRGCSRCRCRSTTPSRSDHYHPRGNLLKVEFDASESEPLTSWAEETAYRAFDHMRQIFRLLTGAHSILTVRINTPTGTS